MFLKSAAFYGKAVEGSKRPDSRRPRLRPFYHRCRKAAGEDACYPGGPYLPMQNSRKIDSNTSSTPIAPVSLLSE